MASFFIKVYKDYFNFAASHFMMFPDGSREPLHGHNYHLQLRGSSHELQGDVVLDFLHIKPLVKELCDGLDHKLLLPESSPHLRFEPEGPNLKVITQDSYFSIPRSDVLLLPISNTSVEVMARYLAGEIQRKVWQQHQFRFATLEVEVEESRGQSAVYSL